MDYLKLVEEINQEIYEVASNGNGEFASFIEENTPLTFTSNGYSHAIDFFGYNIWCSENDERPYENEDDPELCDQMDLEKWIRQEIKRVFTFGGKFSELLQSQNNK